MRYDYSVFVDSDVVISSLISNQGAAYLLISQADLKLYISNISYKEQLLVAERLELDKVILKNLVANRFTIIKLKTSRQKLKEKYSPYVMDINDAHIVAGAVESKVKYLSTYNLRHFKIDKIKADFNIILTTPAKLLQYLRSVKITV